MLCIILVREKNELNKYFRMALWDICLDSILFYAAVLICILLYYNNFFDDWMLIEVETAADPNDGIRLIQMRQEIGMAFDQKYQINVYGYLLVIGFYGICLVLLNIEYLNILEQQCEEFNDFERLWPMRLQVSALQQKQIAMRDERLAFYKDMLELPIPPPKELKELKEQIEEMDI